MVIEYLDSGAGEMLYSNLDDVDSHPHSFHKFNRILAGHSIRLPRDMANAIQADIEDDRGNLYRDWTNSPVEEGWPELHCVGCRRTSTRGWLDIHYVVGESQKMCPDCGAPAIPVAAQSSTVRRRNLINPE